MAERFTIIPLTLDNLLSFEDYIPREYQRMMLRDSVTGWGVLEGDLASGVGIIELFKDTTGVYLPGEEAVIQLNLLWLYVDKEVRRQGIGRQLLAKCREAAEEGGASGICCRYPGEDFEEADDFFYSCGYTVTSDEREDIVDVLRESDDSAMSVHTAWLRIKGTPKTADSELLSLYPGMIRVMPRLSAVASLLEDAGYDDLRYDTTDPGRIAVAVKRGGGLCDIVISILPDNDETSEDYIILVQGIRPCDHNDPDVTRQHLEKWQRKHIMTAGVYQPAEDSVEFTAALPVDDGALSEIQFKAFFTAVCKEIDSF